MEPKGSFPHSQAAGTSPYSEPGKPSPCYTIPILEDPFLILPSHLLLALISGHFPSGFTTKTLNAPPLFPIRATCPVQHILVDLTPRITFSEHYKSQSSSLGYHLQSADPLPL